jgi:hypothetical protein
MLAPNIGRLPRQQSACHIAATSRQFENICNKLRKISYAKNHEMLQCRAVFIDLGLEALWRPRRRAVVARIAPAAGGAGAATGARVLALPRPHQVVFTDPSGVSATRAFHSEIGSRNRFMVNSILNDCNGRQLSTSVWHRSFG